ncbi:uncharacterized protein METZ01_LOCUS258225 [marine metagenome]|uniref:Uncharacterized protein n=1 Tax=marine metagenome TaxID=408172 RepID=A0A382J3H5_9ZZZZ
MSPFTDTKASTDGNITGIKNYVMQNVEATHQLYENLNNIYFK